MKKLYAFLSHAGCDLELAERLARDLMANGIDMFLDHWDIRSGDSIPGKINEALERTTHFLLLVSPLSDGRAWVKAEMDAGLMLRVEGSCTFIAIRTRVPSKALPPLLRSWRSPSLDDYAKGLNELVSDIHGISRRPSLGPLPTILSAATGGAEQLSPAAAAIARIMIERTETACDGDPQLEPEDLRKDTVLNDDDIVDAVHELEGMGFVRRVEAIGMGSIGFIRVVPKADLFSELDPIAKSWIPAADAQQLAADLVNEAVDGIVQNIAQKYDWTPRRLNPAIAYLERRQLIETDNSCGTYPWCCFWVQATHATRRFVKSLSNVERDRVSVI